MRVFHHQKPVFPLQPFVQICIRHRRQQSRHALCDSILPDKLQLPVEDVIRIGIEPQYKSSHHLYPRPLYFFDGGLHVAGGVLFLVGRQQCGGIGRLNADKN